MSPSTLRRYRAERLLRRGFAELRDEVLASVAGRLRARGVHVDGGDLEACYAQAWQGLYAAVDAGEEIASPGGWLAVVTFRRAIDEHRNARSRGLGGSARLDSAYAERAIAGATAGRAHARTAYAAHVERDLAADLDDRAKLRQLFEALRSRLSERECEAAALCYLQGLTRAQAARCMGISEMRMTKLMEGRGAGKPGVTGKVGELLEAIGGGRWCEQQGSLMRGFAFGMLDPRGERYRLARLHQRECPACRAYVLSLRGLAAVLPPLPLPWALPLHSAPTGHAVSHGHPASAGRPASAGHPAPAGQAAGARAGAGGGSVATSGAAGAAGAGAAGGGGWLLGGSVGAKLAVGCLLALSVGCVAITATPHHARHPGRDRQRHAATAAVASTANASSALIDGAQPRVDLLAHPSYADRGAQRRHAKARPSPTARAAAIRRAQARHAQREFGLEQAASTVAVATHPEPSVARAASAEPGETAASSTEPATTARPAAPAGPPSHAEREFGPE
jgi:DNA-directed RNA polymerase specialized sigma24 family protein